MRRAGLLLAAAVLWLASAAQALAAANPIGDEAARRAIAVESNETEGWPQGPVVSAQSAVVMEVSSGAVLYEKNAHDPLYPASITKILTTLVVLENSSMDETVTFSHDSLFSLDPGSSIIGGVNEGDQMSMKDVLYGIMICSGNEAAYAAAEHVGGTVEHFTEMMNERARQIGCTDSNFCNPHGLPDDSHVTSAMDMALITREALENSSFYTIATTRRYEFPPTSSGEQRLRLNHHQMMEGMEYEYEGCLGGKTGYTSKAGSTLVTFAQRDGMTLVCVVMNEDSPAQYTDTAALLDYGFSNFRKTDMSSYGTGQEEGTDSFFLQEIEEHAAQMGISTKRTGTAVIPDNVGENMLEGEVVSEEDGLIVTDFYYHGKYVGESSMELVTQEGQAAGRIFGSGGQEDGGYNILTQTETPFFFINVKYVAAGLAVLAVAAGLVALRIRSGARRRRIKRLARGGARDMQDMLMIERPARRRRGRRRKPMLLGGLGSLGKGGTGRGRKSGRTDRRGGKKWRYRR